MALDLLVDDDPVDPVVDAGPPALAEVEVGEEEDTGSAADARTGALRKYPIKSCESSTSQGEKGLFARFCLKAASYASQ